VYIYTEEICTSSSLSSHLHRQPFQVHLANTSLPHIRFTVRTMKSLLLYLSIFASSVSALGNAIILNNSTQTIYAWSVGASIGPRQTIVSGIFPRPLPFHLPHLTSSLFSTGGLYLEPLHHDPSSGGIALKITTTPNGLYTGDPQQVFSYNLDGDNVWYDLSTVFGAPFQGDRVEVTSNTGKAIIWVDGVHPGGSMLRSARNGENIWWTVYGKR
jgi:hypothetical protein